MRRLSLLLVCTLLLGGCSGAGNSPAADAGQAFAGEEQAIAGAEQAGTGAVPSVIAGGRSVIDAAGQVHEVPENKQATTIASVYAVAVPFIVALDLSDRVLAVNVKSNFWTDAVPGLAAAGSVGRGAVDLEALAGYSPDVLIHRSNDAATVENVTGRLGIAVLCIEVENFDDIMGTLEMMGSYFGAEQRAADVSSWLTGKFEFIDGIVRQIPDSERVSAIVMGSRPFRVAGGDMLQSWMIEKAGGISLTADIENNRNWADIGTETIFEFNPDYIFCTSSTMLDYSVEQLLGDNAWSAVTAIRNEDIYRIPATIDSWDLPGISSALGTMYMLHMMYPGYFTADDLQREIDEYYTFMFGRTFDSRYLAYTLER